MARYPECYTMVAGPSFVGKYPVSLESEPVVRVKNPAVDVIILENVHVMGGSFLVFKDKFAIHPNEYTPSRDVMPLEVHELGWLNDEFTEITVKVSSSKSIDLGFSLIGQCTGNYAHWLTETLPKLLVLNELPEFDGVPVLVDEWIHPNFYKSIEHYTGGSRSIIHIDRWKFFRVNKLIDISPPCYIPYELRKSKTAVDIVHEVRHDYFSFSKKILDKYREYSDAASSAADKKVYIQRGKTSVGNGRLVENIEEVEAVIKSYGYEFVDPANMSFNDQVSYFKNVKCVISPIGAALTNLVFSPKGCKVVIMSPYYEGANYYYFSSLLSILGHEVKFVLGPQQNYLNGHLLHRNYSVNIDYLKSALEASL